MLVTMPSTSSQYLQVPKLVPHRKSRSRSRSQPHGIIVPLESPTKEVFVSKPAVQLRTPSPAPPVFSVPPPSLEVKASKPPSPPTIPQKRSMEDLNPVKQPQTSYGGMDGFKSEISIEPQTTPTPPAPVDLNGSIYLDDDELMTDDAPPQIPLRQRIIGAWKLDSYVAYPTPSSPIQRPTFPMTKNVTGFIMYTPDGYLSAQMLIPGQQSFKRGEGEEPQWAEAGKRFFGYCGPYYITSEGNEEVLRHTFQVCNLPGWIGDLQVRTWRFEEEGDVLVLGSESPTEIKGDKRIPVLKWRRAKDNSAGVPPPPTPQIKISGPGEP